MDGVKVSHTPNDLSKTGKKWIFYEKNHKDLLYLKQTYNLSDLEASLALNRMKTLEESVDVIMPLLKTHLPDPCVLPDSAKAFEFTHNFLLKNEKIAVWGDYDVDGACAAALFVRYFQSLSYPIVAYIPDRFQEGYGPNEKGLHFLKEQGISTVFIVDCGTTSFEALAWAHKHNLNIIIIDHHRVGSSYPNCIALLNPTRPDYEGPEILKSLCAGGLVYLFLIGLNRYLKQKNYFQDSKEIDLIPLLDLVALSTICDMVPLRGLNRVFVKQGLKVMGKRKNMGLNALFDLSKIKKHPTASDLSYVIGPRINAGGRIGDSSLGVKLLSCDDPYETKIFAQELELLNKKRQYIERHVEESAYQQALLQKEENFLMLLEENWHEGVLGIVAGRLKDIFYKPSFVFTTKGSFIKGSARSVSGTDIGKLITSAYENGILLSGGGHPMAGGLSLKKEKIEEFKAFVHDFFSKNEPKKDPPYLEIDHAINLQTLGNQEFIKAIEWLEPFGVGHPSPKFLLSNIRFETFLPFGANHFRTKLVQLDGKTYPAVAFRALNNELGKWISTSPSQLVECVIFPRVERNFGLCKVHLILEDIR